MSRLDEWETESLEGLLKRMPRYPVPQEVWERQRLRLQEKKVHSLRPVRRFAELAAITAAVVAILVFLPQWVGQQSGLGGGIWGAGPGGPGTGETAAVTGSGEEERLQENDEGRTAMESAGTDDTGNSQRTESEGEPGGDVPQNAVELMEVPRQYTEQLPADAYFLKSYALHGDFNGDGKTDYAVIYGKKPEEPGQPPGEPRVRVFFGGIQGGTSFSLDPIYQLVKFEAQDITGDGRPELLVGNGLGASVGNQLLVYEWLADGAEDTFRLVDQIGYHRLDIADFDNDGLRELAVWTKDTGDAYQVEVLQYVPAEDKERLGGIGSSSADSQTNSVGNPFQPDTEAYPYYFPHVVQYYDKRVKEMPQARFYWYYLADALLKTGDLERAKEAIEKGLALAEGYPEDQRFLDMAEKYGIQLTVQSTPR